jgi:AcrR family transcriptional regulator
VLPRGEAHAVQDPVDGATSVGQIAEEAGVAVPTVYTSAGTKPALLRQLLDRMDQVAGIPELAAELMASDDAHDADHPDMVLDTTDWQGSRSRT